MEQIILPNKIEYQADPENKNKGYFTIEPCYPGYGITWGNALRRVLLSSLPGAAVDSIKIKGGRHEFSTLPHVEEDILHLVLNFKQLRFKVFREEPIQLKLSVKGEKEVTAKDIEKSADVEIVNPDLHLATLTDKKAELEIEINISKGFGYIPSEEKDRTGLDLGTIVLDSIFSPIVKIASDVEDMRVGKRTDYDRLKLTIETDGTITPYAAFVEAADLLNSQFAFLTGQARTIAQGMDIKSEEKTVKAKKAKAKVKTVKKVIKKKVVKAKSKK
ncbi:MAG: DNA-directed RNA polymerase subunit alpha [Patescibacteria group bacterium]|nr:DNA-directed RNA polymerase subunit alpha [Patescibacteria group bacterium]MDD5121387.1 DNA-directed RNA polymerase subunit alpha [Patescibacteria group bacterium]MDD5221794.1 DNA-directed RNA polymerase subunit alpha [Patescibacteria group bacterium]MDD5395694.1 DNA-directed RNA polymerase subunit alpha [Patescibacteria group bacterium]